MSDKQAIEKVAEFFEGNIPYEQCEPAARDVLTALKEMQAEVDCGDCEGTGFGKKNICGVAVTFDTIDCKTCNGKGKLKLWKVRECEVCEGTGELPRDGETLMHHCPECMPPVCPKCTPLQGCPHHSTMPKCNHKGTGVIRTPLTVAEYNKICEEYAYSSTWLEWKDNVLYEGDEIHDLERATLPDGSYIERSAK